MCLQCSIIHLDVMHHFMSPEFDGMSLSLVGTDIAVSALGVETADGI